MAIQRAADPEHYYREKILPHRKSLKKKALDETLLEKQKES